MGNSGGPVAGRLRRPGWADPRLLIGAGLVAVGVVGTASTVANADRTEPVYAAAHTLTPGTVLTERNLVVAHVRVGAGDYVGAEDEPWGRVVTRTIGDGELVPASALAAGADYDARPVAVTTSRPLAEGIEPGAIVDVWFTREGVGGPESVLVASGLVVDQVDRADGAFSTGAGETVYVVVPAREVGDFLAALAEDGEVAVVGIAGTAP